MDMDMPHEADKSYEPPRVECVLTTEELAREIQYAGNGTVVTDMAQG